MPPATSPTDPDLLLREAMTGVAVAAYSRGINMAAHVDNRMLSSITPEAEDLTVFLRRGLQRTVEAGHTGKIGLALWFDGIDPDGTVRAQIEVCRQLWGDGAPVSRLADLWALPLGGAPARPVTGRHDEAGESVLIPLRLAAPRGTPATAARWRGVFRGRRLLHVRDVLFDRDRLRRSMSAVGVEVMFASSPDEALAVLRAGAARGEPIDAMVVDGHALGMAAVDLARQVRAEPRLAPTRIVLASAIVGAALAAEDAALFDVEPWSAVPWRRLFDVLADLFRESADFPGATAGTAPAVARAGADGGTAIPDLAGCRILIAEDVATNEVLLKAMLRPTGALVEAVADGAALLARHRASPADLILMDLQMPGMGGITAIRRLRALPDAAGTVPVVALTAYARRADRQRALDAGTDAYLAKPVVVPEFYALLRRLLPECAGSDR